MRVVSIVVFEMLYLLCKDPICIFNVPEVAKPVVHSYILLIAGDHVNENHPKAALIACLLF